MDQKMNHLEKIASNYDKESFLVLNEEMSFEEYINRCYENPRLVRTSSQRIYDMIMSKGSYQIEKYRKTLTHYNFFDDPNIPIFGLEDTLDQLMKFIKGAAGGYGTEKRILLLHGPVGSSKSTICRLLKKGLEDYSRTPEGAWYTFKWVNLPTGADGIYTHTEDECPMHEEPLKLLPVDARAKILKELNANLRESTPENLRTSLYKLKVEGDLDPRCRKFMNELLKRNQGDWKKVVQNHIVVIRKCHSEAERMGIATFQPKDEKNQDSTELTGDINFGKIKYFGSDSDPRCIAFGTEVVTSSGVSLIDDYVSESYHENELRPMNDLVQAIEGPAGTQGVFYNGKQECVNVVTQYGYEITCTPHHKLFVMGKNGQPEWKKAGEINPDDYVALHNKVDMWGEDQVLSILDFKLYGNESSDFNQPTKVTPELGYFTGLWLGDGHMYKSKTNHEIGYTQIESNRQKEFSELCGRLFNLSMRDIVKDNQIRGKRSGCHRFYDWMVYFLGGTQKSINKKIPDSIYYGSRDTILACLRGLFETDGNLYAGCKTNTASFVTMSKILAKQVHSLLLRVGVLASLRLTSGWYTVSVGGDHVNTLCEVIPSLKDRITSGTLREKRNTCRTGGSPHTRSLMKAIISDYRKNNVDNENLIKRFSGNIYDSRKIMVNRQTVEDFLEATSGSKLEEYESLKKINELPVFWVKVKQINPAGILPVADISVHKVHNYWANGFVAHNSFNYDGELCCGNRGIVEFIEMLKLDQAFLYDLLGASQEQNIKPKKFSQIKVDLFIIGHSVSGNEPICYRKNNNIYWTTLEKLHDDYANNTNDIEVLAHNFDDNSTNWTKVKDITKHRWEGRLITTKQKWGIVETTPNHALYSRDGSLFMPEDEKEVMAVRSIPLTHNFNEIDILDIMPKGFLCDHTVSTLLGHTKPPAPGMVRSVKARAATQLLRNYSGDSLKDLLTFLVWYTTEGHTDKNASVVISQSDTAELKRVQLAIRRISDVDGFIQDVKEETGVDRLIYGSYALRDIAETLCGCGAENKRLPDFVFSLEKEYIKHVLTELSITDGTVKCNENASDEYKKEFFSYKTTSRMLAAQVGYLMALVGKDYNVKTCLLPSGKTAYDIVYIQGHRKLITNCRTSSRPATEGYVYDIGCEGLHNFACGVGMLICHNSNQPEFQKLKANQFMEAFKDRTVKIDVPYLLKLSDEIKVLEQDYGPNADIKQHVAPHTLEIAALWAILTRMQDEKDGKLQLTDKVDLYNGKLMPGWTEDAVKELRDRYPDEGMTGGISARYIQDKISNCLSDNHNYINPFMVLNELKDGLDNHSLLSNKDQVGRYTTCIEMAVKKLDQILKSEVQKALVGDEDAIIRLCANYIDNVMAYIKKSKVKNPYTGREESPDERLMRNIESKIDVPDKGADDFRRMIAAFIGDLANQGKKFHWDSNAQLQKALEAKLFEDVKDTVKLSALSVSGSAVVDPDIQEKIDAIKTRLIKNYGYSEDSARDVLEYVGGIFARGDLGD